RDGSVYAVDASTGHVRWRRKLTGVVDDAPAVSGDRVFVVGEEVRTGRTTLHALDASTGRSRWSYSPPRASLGVSSPTVAGNTVYAGFGDVTVRAFDVRSGAIRWDQPVRGLFSPLSTLAAAGGSVYALDGDGGVYRFDAATGRRRWDYQFPAFVSWSSPLVTESGIYVGLDDGTLAALSPSTGHLVWETRPRFGPIGALTPAGDLLLVPAIGASGGVVAFRHDPSVVLLDVPSPTQVKVPAALLNY